LVDPMRRQSTLMPGPARTAPGGVIEQQH